MDSLRISFGVFAFALLSQAALASSSLEGTDFDRIESRLHDLRSRVMHIHRTSPPACPKETAPVVLFAFEGAGGYAPKAALLKLEFSRMRNDFYRLSGAERQRLAPLVNEMEQAVKKEKHLSDPILLSALSKADQSSFSRPTILYYSKNQNRAAALCAKKIWEEAKSAGRTVEFHAVGYSMGGHAVLQFGRKLATISDAFISKMLAVDPVGKGLHWTRSLFAKLYAKKNDPHLKRPKQVGELSCFYQRLDRKTMWVGIHGSAVKDADLNTELKALDFKNSGYSKPEYSHTAILDVTPVSRRLAGLWASASQ